MCLATDHIYKKNTKVKSCSKIYPMKHNAACESNIGSHFGAHDVFFSANRSLLKTDSTTCIPIWQILGAHTEATVMCGQPPVPQTRLFQVKLLYVCMYVCCCIATTYTARSDVHKSLDLPLCEPSALAMPTAQR